MDENPAPSAAAGRSVHRDDIDGLRAIAVTSVVLFHAGLFPFASGFVGVDVFFVISGYLIGSIILREASEGRFSFVRFYARRARRILPALFAVVLATCLAGSLLLTANEFKDVGALGTAALLGVSNINFWQYQDYFADDSRLRTLLMTWSLGVEEQFYVVFPFLVLLAVQLGRRWVAFLLSVLTLGSFGLSLWWTRTAPAAAFYLLPARAWELGAGAMLAAWELNRILAGRARGFGLGAPLRNALAVAGLASLVVGMTCLDEHAPFPGLLALLPVLGTVGLLVAQGSAINRLLLSTKPFVFVGLVSYSWYLWHWPLLSLARIVVPRPLPVAATAGIAAVSFGLAILSWRFVEQPFRSGRFRSSAIVLRYACALAAVASVPIAIRAAAGFPQRFTPQVAELERFVAELRRGECLVRNGELRSTDKDCRAPASGRPVVAVLGDSHAWAVGPRLRQLAGQAGLDYEIFAKSSCTPVLGVSVRLAMTPEFPEECTAFKDNALRAILADARVEVVVLAGYWSAPEKRNAERGYVRVPEGDPTESGLALLRSGLKAMIDQLAAANKRVIVLQDVPDMGIDPLRIALDEYIPARRLVADWFDHDVDSMRSGRLPLGRVDRHDDVRAMITEVAAASGADLKDPFPRFCDQASCAFSLGGEPLYFDHHHLSPVGASLALRGLVLTRN